MHNVHKLYIGVRLSEQRSQRSLELSGLLTVSVDGAIDWYENMSLVYMALATPSSSNQPGSNIIHCGVGPPLNHSHRTKE